MKTLFKILVIIGISFLLWKYYSYIVMAGKALYWIYWGIPKTMWAFDDIGWFLCFIYGLFIHYPTLVFIFSMLGADIEVPQQTTTQAVNFWGMQHWLTLRDIKTTIERKK